MSMINGFGNFNIGNWGVAQPPATVNSSDAIQGAFYSFGGGALSMFPSFDSGFGFQSTGRTSYWGTMPAVFGMAGRSNEIQDYGGILSSNYSFGNSFGSMGFGLGGMTFANTNWAGAFAGIAHGFDYAMFGQSSGGTAAPAASYAPAGAVAAQGPVEAPAKADKKEEVKEAKEAEKKEEAKADDKWVREIENKIQMSGIDVDATQADGKKTVSVKPNDEFKPADAAAKKKLRDNLADAAKDNKDMKVKVGDKELSPSNIDDVWKELGTLHQANVDKKKADELSAKPLDANSRQAWAAAELKKRLATGYSVTPKAATEGSKSHELVMNPYGKSADDIAKELKAAILKVSAGAWQKRSRKPLDGSSLKIIIQTSDDMSAQIAALNQAMATAKVTQRMGPVVIVTQKP